jgi:predicted lipid carrier protein YhbT
VRTFVGLRLLEVVVHGWDMRSPLEPMAALAPESAAVLVEWWPAFVTWGLQSEGPRASGGRFRFVFTDDGLSPYDLLVEGERVRMAPAEQVSAQVTFRCEAAAFVLLVCGRRPLDTLVAEGCVVLEGDRDRVTAFRQCFQGM